MEFGIKIKNIEQLGSVKDKYNFIYFGDECCERKIPGLSFAQKVFEYCIKKGKTPVLLSPLVTDSGIKKLRVLIKELYILKEDFELTINDFGVLNLMKEFPNIKINCGRLLIKMKKGPEILSTVLSKNVETFKANSLTNKLYNLSFDIKRRNSAESLTGKASRKSFAHIRSCRPYGRR